MICALALTVLANGAMAAEEAKTPKAPKAEAVHVLSAADLNPILILPPAPKDGSALAQRELQEVRAIVAQRTPEALAHATKDAEDESISLYAEVMGERFRIEDLPVTKAFFTDVLSEQKPFAKVAKEHFSRNRPWAVDPELKVCEKINPAKAKLSYPSGHTTVGFTLGVVLAAIAPEKADLILDRARDYAESRIVCGAHFRSDTIAGEVLGTSIALKLLDRPQIKARMNEVRAELIAKGVLAAK